MRLWTPKESSKRPVDHVIFVICLLFGCAGGASPEERKELQMHAQKLLVEGNSIADTLGKILEKNQSE
jgi:hypothetical protein